MDGARGWSAEDMVGSRLENSILNSKVGGERWLLPARRDSEVDALHFVLLD